MRVQIRPRSGPGLSLTYGTGPNTTKNPRIRIHNPAFDTQRRKSNKTNLRPNPIIAGAGRHVIAEVISLARSVDSLSLCWGSLKRFSCQFIKANVLPRLYMSTHLPVENKPGQTNDIIHGQLAGIHVTFVQSCTLKKIRSCKYQNKGIVPVEGQLKLLPSIRQDGVKSRKLCAVPNKQTKPCPPIGAGSRDKYWIIRPHYQNPSPYICIT